MGGGRIIDSGVVEHKTLATTLALTNIVSQAKNK